MKQLAASAIALTSTFVANHFAHADAVMGTPVFIEDTPKIDPHDTGTETYLTLGLLSSPAGGSFGLRAQLDLLSVAGLSLGAGGTLFAGGVRGVDPQSYKASAVAYAAYTAPLFRNFKLRGQLGFGGDITLEQDATTMMATTTRSQIFEGSLFLSGRANHDWSVLGGPILQRTVSTQSPDSTVMVFVGLQRRY